VAGDFDKEETKSLIEKYFGEIAGGEKLAAPQPQPVSLDSSKMAFHEDHFARSPELTMVFPTVEQYHPDSYALDFLGQLLAYGKKAPMYKVIVEDKRLAPRASAYNMSSEIAGEFQVSIRTFPKINLNDVKNAIAETFGKFEAESFTEQDVERIKAGIETSFYNALSSILGKSFQLARYNEYAGSPDYLTTHLEKIQAVTKEDIIRVYETYLKNKPYVLTCFVPKGEFDLVVEGAEQYPILEEAFTAAEKPAASSAEEFKVEPMPTSFDRSVEPTLGPDPVITLPQIWKDKLSNGLELYGIEHRELPLVQFTVTVKGGMLLDDFNKVGVANLVSDLMMEGTRNKTPLELEEAIDDLGARISMYTGRESITLRVNCLSSKFADVYNLVQEIFMEPRWDEKEFDRIKRETLETMNRNKANPNAISSAVFNELVYGEKHIFRFPTTGNPKFLDSITLDDVKTFYQNNFSPSVTLVVVAGDISQTQVVDTFKSLENTWASKEVFFPEYPLPEPREQAMVCFVDVPDAKQSVIRIGDLGLAYSDPDYFPATIMNYKLGGSFNSIVNMILREEKGYTYGARSGFSGAHVPGTFAASSSVESRATLESVQIFKDSMTKYREGILPEDLEFTKSALVKAYARQFETLGSLVGMLDNIANYGLPFDYVKQQENIVRSMTLDQHQNLAQKYLKPGSMIYLVVGDAATQMKPLEQLGLGKSVLIENK
jgi:zinc protease